MFCLQCGTQIPDGSKFCMFCGAKLDVQMSVAAPSSADVGMSDDLALVPTEDTQTNISAIPKSVPVPNAAKQAVPPYIIEFCGRKLQFEYSFERYNDLRRRFFDRSNAVQKEFVDYYKANVHDFDTLFDKGLECFLAKSKEFLEFSVSIVHKNGGHDIDEEYFLQYSNDAKVFCSAMNYFREVSILLTNLAETMASYRAAKSARRSYWQGGGFGIAGAIKGALTASALNLGTDMMRSIGSAVSNSSDRAKLRKLEQDIYQERDHCQGLVSALNSWFGTMWRITENALKERHLLEVPAFDTGEALAPIMEAENIVHNATDSTLDTEYERAIDLICQGLPHDPYFPIIAYTSLYQIPQTDKKEIQEFVRFLGIEEEYNRKKAELVEDLLAPILKMPETTIEQIDTKLNAFRDSHEKYSGVDICPHIERLNSKKGELIQVKAKEAEKESSRIALQKRLQNAVEIRSKVLTLNNPSGYSALWDLADQNIAHAQWILTVNYDPSRYVGDYYTKLRTKYANEIKERANSGSLFAQYLVAWYPFDDAFRHRVSTKPLSPIIKDSTEIIYVLAKKGVIAAMSKCGLWGTQRDRASNPFIHWSEAEAVGFLKAAAEADDTQALLRLSSFYKDGLFGFPQNEALMKECDTIRDCYSTGRISNPYSKSSPSSNSTSSSDCFITSAICRTFSKPDDCYELTTFRNFRDNWFAKQPDGQALIQEYYRIAPTIVEHIDQRSDSKEIYQSIWDAYLTPCLHHIEAQQFDECRNIYITMVNDLKRKYGR